MDLYKAHTMWVVEQRTLMIWCTDCPLSIADGDMGQARGHALTHPGHLVRTTAVTTASMRTYEVPASDVA